MKTPATSGGVQYSEQSKHTVLLATHQTHIHQGLHHSRLTTTIMPLRDESQLKRHMELQRGILILDARFNGHFDGTLNLYYMRTFNVPVIHLVHSLHEARLLYLLGISSDMVAFVNGPMTTIKTIIEAHM